MYRHIGITLFFVALSAYGQIASDLFSKAPPHIDEALRARVTKFYDLHVQAKYRQADALVAEDSKDVFFSADKVRCYSFEIVKLTYTDNFTKATALITCESDFVASGRRLRVKMPLTSLWKTIEGEWFWYALPASETMSSPFGTMRPGPNPDTPTTAVPDIKARAEEILRSVEVDHPNVNLSSYQDATDTVVLTNRMNGKVQLALEFDPVKGLEAKIDKAELSNNEKATVTFSYKPPDKGPKPTMTVRVRVKPTEQVIPLTLTFAVPPEVQKLIRKR